MKLLHIFIPILFVSVFFYHSKGIENQFSDAESKEQFILSSQLLTETKDSWDDEFPILLWWTGSVFRDRSTKSVSKITCRSGDCLTSVNRDLMQNPRTRGLLFYGTDIFPGDMPLPRLPWHEWALFHEESPLNNYMLCHQSFLRLFNHTATCRRESDFPLTLQWILNNDYLTSRQPLPLILKNQIKHEEGLAPVLYIQSHCEVPSDRDRYVKELMKYIKIDSYGKCLNNKKIKKQFESPVENLNNPKFLDFIAQYKFHISFENAFLKDYMTEKLMRAFHVGSVPVYKGSSSAKDWIPGNKSVIFIDDFESPEHLANFIKHLDENGDKYNAYLKFKDDGVTNSLLLQSLLSREWRMNEIGYPNMIQSFECYVCDEIRKRLEAEKEKKAIPPKAANHSHYGCQQPYTLLVDPSEVPSNDSWHKIDWIDLYWKGLDDSLVVNAMIQANETDSSKFQQYLNRIYQKRRKS